MSYVAPSAASPVCRFPSWQPHHTASSRELQRTSPSPSTCAFTLFFPLGYSLQEKLQTLPAAKDIEALPEPAQHGWVTLHRCRYAALSAAAPSCEA